MTQPKAICVDVSQLLVGIWCELDDNARRLYDCTFNLAVIQSLFEEVFCVVVSNKIPLPQRYIQQSSALYTALTSCVWFEYMSTFSSTVSIYLDGTYILIVEET